MLDLAASMGIVEKSGAWFSYQGERIGQGRERSREFLLENRDVLETIERKVREKGQIRQGMDETQKEEVEEMA